MAGGCKIQIHFQIVFACWWYYESSALTETAATANTLDAGGACNFTIIINEYFLRVFSVFKYRIVLGSFLTQMLLLTLRIHLSCH